MTGLMCFLCGVGVMWCLTKLNSKYKLDFIDEEDVEFVDELENPKKYHYEEHSDDTIHIYKDGEEIICDEIVDLLNEQDETIQEYKHLVKIATSLIGWNTIPQVRRDWEKHLSKVDGVE